MARTTTSRPFPLAPLLEAARPTSLVTFSQMLGVHRRQLYRLRDYGLTLDQADTLAFRLGLHPVEVWPEEYQAC